MSVPKPSLLDSGQTLQGSYDEETGSLRTKTDANESSVEVFQLDADALQTTANLAVEGSPVTEQNPIPTINVDVPFKTIIETSGLTTYIGEAIPGSPTVNSVWRIQRILKSGSITTVSFPDGDASFGFSWDMRSTYVYS